MARTSQAKRKLSTTNQPLGGSIKRAKSGQEEQPPSPESSGSKNTELNTDDVEAKGNEGKAVEAAKSEHKDSPQGKATFYLWADALMEWIDDSPEELVFRLKSAVLAEWSRVQAASSDLSEEDKQDLIAEAASKVDQWYVEELGREDDERSELAHKFAEIAEAIMKEESSKEKAKKGEDKDADEDDEEANDGWWWELQLQREQPKDGVPAIEVKLFEGRGKEGDPESYNGRWWWTGVSPADEVGLKALSSMIDYLAARLV